MCFFSKKEPPRREVVRFAGYENDIIWKKEFLDCDFECEVVSDAFHKVVYMKDGRPQEDISGERIVLNTNEKKAKNQQRFDIALYFVNVTNYYTVKWGTRQQARVIDGFYQIPVSFGLSGDFKITVENAHKLVAKLCSARSDVDNGYIEEFFGSQMTMHVLQVLTEEIQSGRMNVYSLYKDAAETAAELQKRLANVFIDFGVKVNNLGISAVTVSESDIRQFEEVLKKKRLLEMKDTNFREEAADYKEDRKNAMDTIVKLAEIDANKNKHNITINNNNGNTVRFCPYCGTKLTGGAAFCSGCGKKVD